MVRRLRKVLGAWRSSLTVIPPFVYVALALAYVLKSPYLESMIPITRRILLILGQKKAQRDWQDKAVILQDALLAELWNGSEFVGRLVHQNKKAVDSQSLVSCMPIVLGKSAAGRYP